MKYCKLAVVILVLMLILSSCAEQAENVVVCDEESWCRSEVIGGIVLGYTVQNEYKSELSAVKSGMVAEAYDLLAVPALELGVAGYWYPQYRATAVIAIDRERTDAGIYGWSDLLNSNVQVGFSDKVPEIRLLMAAMSYGLEGENYTLDAAAALLSKLHAEGRLELNRYDAPVLICLDYQAAALVKQGRSLEIIVPKEGTLTYEKGFLSAKSIKLAAEADKMLVSAGYRLADGRCDTGIYPAPESYAVAVSPPDLERLGRVSEDVVYVFKRDVLQIKSYIYSSDDGREHQLFALTFIILVIAWTGYVVRRIMQKGVKRAALTSAVMIIGWVFLRMTKYQIPLGTLSQYCWYGYYLFQLGIGLSVLWMSWATDQPAGVIYPPRWWLVCAGISGLLFLLVVTNNFHHLAFVFSPDDPNYNVNYVYGPVYYLCIGFILIEALAAQILFMQKSWKSPRRAAFLFPVLFYGLLVLYCVGYVLRVPLAWETDLTIVVGVFVVLFIEACIRSKLIPVNTKYKRIFENSPLKIQIVGANNETVLASAFSGDSGEDYHVYTDKITGGRVVWQEDISSINRLRRETLESVAELTAANAILTEEERIKSRLASAEARTALFAELEAEIEKKSSRLLELIENLPSEEDAYRRRAAELTLLLCYIKRRCNLFFREREAVEIQISELSVYLDELGEYADLAGVKMLVTCGKNGSVPSAQAVLFYDFLYAIAEWAVLRGGKVMLVQLFFGEAMSELKIMFPECETRFELEQPLCENIAAAGGNIQFRDLDDAESVTLSFDAGYGGYCVSG